MPMVDGDWAVDRATKVISYEGYDHIGGNTITTGAFVTGDYYMIRVVGDTDFTLIGASSNTVGVRFEATGAGGGTTGKATQIASYATVIQLHRWLQALADDDEFTGDDELDIIDKNPSDRSTDNLITLRNGYTITATEIEHLYDGTIIQGSGPTEERWDGIVNFGNANAHIQVIQNGAIISDDYWNYGWQKGTATSTAAVLNDTTQSWTNDEWIGYTIKNVTDGSMALITDNDATSITGVLYGGTLNTWTSGNAYNIAAPINGDSAQGISHRFMIKTRDFGVDIDRRKLLGTTRRYYNTYGEFPINGTSLGNNVLALSDSGDLNNTTAWATIDALADIANTEGLRNIDIDNDTITEEYYSEWDRGANSINTFYEYLKAESMDSSGATLNGQNGELHRGLTHSVPYDSEVGTPSVTTNDKFVWGTYVNHGTVTSGPFVVGEAVHEDTATPVWKGRVLSVDGTDTSLVIDIESGTVGNTESFTGQTSGAQATTSSAPTGSEIQSSGGEFAIFAWDDDTGTGNFYGQLTKGNAMPDNSRLYDPADHTDYYVCSASATERTVSTPFAGASTGSALIGAYGLGLQKADTSDADTYFDLQNNPITPPNTVTFTASGFISGDYVLCTEDDGGDINFDQMSLNATYSATNVTTISVGAIPSDTPTSDQQASGLGGIRIQRADGLYSLHRYSALDLATDDFTIPSHDFSTNNANSGANVFVSYIDKTTSSTSEVFSYVYSSDRTHFLRVRDGGGTPIKTAEATGVMTTTGGTASVSRIDDV
jgi:hypothetical protein